MGMTLGRVLSSILAGNEGICSLSPTDRIDERQQCKTWQSDPRYETLLFQGQIQSVGADVVRALLLYHQVSLDFLGGRFLELLIAYVEFLDLFVRSQRIVCSFDFLCNHVIDEFVRDLDSF
jgi:hypothetical protein